MMSKVRVNYEKMYYGFPAILVSFYDQYGVPNVTPISSSYTLKDMMVLGFNSKGYAVQQIKEVRDFVVNVPDQSLQNEVDYCGAHTGHDCHKFDFVQLTPAASTVVHAPLIQECPISIECSLTEFIERDEFGGITNLIARIKGRCLEEDYVTADGGLLISRVHNINYFGDGRTRGFKYTK